MKRLLLPVLLICFAIFCLSYIHIDNMNKINEEKAAIEKQKEDAHLLTE